MSRAEIEAIQLKRLKETVRRVYEKVEPYRRKMEEVGIKPEDIRTLKDLEKLPFTTKQDMRDNYPYGLFAVPLKKLRRIHASSGTTGKPTVVGYTEQDLEVWKECVARLAAAAGGTEDDIAQICFGYGMFTGALGLHCGLEKLGAAIIPSSTGNTQKQLMYMKDFGATLLVATPSYAMRIAEVAKEIGIDPKKDLKVKTLVLGSELMTEAMRKELHKVWGEDAKITQNYGMSELMGPGVSGECQELNGMHINEDHFIAEVIDPKTGQVLPAGEKGELVVTCLSKEAPAPDSLPHQGYYPADVRALLLRPYHRQDGEFVRPYRRHAKDSGRQRIPQPNRGGAHQHRGHWPQLRDSGGTAASFGFADHPGRGGSGEHDGLLRSPGGPGAEIEGTAEDDAGPGLPGTAGISQYVKTV